MPIVPKPILERVQFYQTRMPHIAACAGQLRLSPDDLADLQARVEAASAAYLAQQEAMRRARGTTRALEAAMAALTELGARVIGRVHGAAGEHPDIHRLTCIPARAKRTPMAPPGTPDRFAATLDARGALRLTWFCKNPRGAEGTMYQVSRRASGAGEAGAFEYLGAVGKKRFTDATIPAGATSLDYRVRAVRSKKAGGYGNHTVRFGAGGGRLAGRPLDDGVRAGPPDAARAA